VVPLPAQKFSPGPTPRQAPAIDLMGMRLSCMTAPELLDEVFGGLQAGRGGWIVTANLDFLRRHHREASMRALYAQADLRVADGMPLVWAARVQGTPLPERIAGASLVRPLALRAAASARSLYLLGGDGDTARQCAEVLRQENPRLRIAGHSNPRVAANPSAESLSAVRETLELTAPDIVLVALGSPKQEQVISRLREHFSKTWFMGVGASFSFVTGHISRAPIWMQRSGLEWVYRLSQEPERLARRYLVHDAPFGLQLLAHAALQRWSQNRSQERT
jgi:N-acetylglucosaminyldiphosphoundecaprenol N-acetyl-beta-D-mannosaminyltransferase